LIFDEHWNKHLDDEWRTQSTRRDQTGFRRPCVGACFASTVTLPLSENGLGDIGLGDAEA